MQLPDWAIPYSATPLPAAYGWIESLAIGFVGPDADLVVRVNMDAASAGLTPIDKVHLRLGDEGLPTAAEFLADPDVAAAMATIRGKLYALLTASPRFPGATQVP